MGLLYYPFGNGCVHLLTPAVVTYLAMVLCRPHCGTIAWVFTFPYLIAWCVFGCVCVCWGVGGGGGEGCGCCVRMCVCERERRDTILNNDTQSHDHTITQPHTITHSHVMKASGTSWKEGALDFTGAQMVITLRIIAVAVCCQDGSSSDKVGDEVGSDH